MTDDWLDAFDEAEKRLAAKERTVPIENAPEPEPAEPWHNEPPQHEQRPAQPYPSPELRERIAYVPPEPAHKLKPLVDGSGRTKTPDDFTWRECWMRVTELWLKGIMDRQQFVDLTAMATVEHASTTMLGELRMRLWAYESIADNVASEGSSGRTGDTPTDRREHPRAGSTDQRLRDTLDRSRDDDAAGGAENSGGDRGAEQTSEAAG